MKNLLLTSEGAKIPSIQAEIVKFFKQPPKEIRLAYITTAANYKEYDPASDQNLRALQQLGFPVFTFDIEGQDESSISQFLADKDAIYVRGGNSFYLLDQIKKSGFDVVVKELVEKGMPYIGGSAGSYVACPTIEMANWKQQDRNIVNLQDLTALGLINFLIVVHYAPEMKAVIQGEVRKSKYPVKILTDGQALLIRGDEVSLVGQGDEIVL